ncbi:hypothetical protein GGE24_007254 [Bradyrhizobium centrosematis]|nr:hypothetical protein [Bradyrhizobium centrosematis]MCS3777879.1 hypothetical protein [Bradyrhizobium centrosematis]
MRCSQGGAASASRSRTCLAGRDRTDTGHHLARWQVTVADDALVAILGLQIEMLTEKASST